MWEGLKRQADYIYLSGDQIPDFRTLNEYRRRHSEELAGIFTQIVFLCGRLGMIGFEHLAIDGQKIQANASYRRSLDNKRLGKRYENVKKGLKKLLEMEPTEEISKETKEKRLKRLKREQEDLLELSRKLSMLEDDKANINRTDEEAHTMKHKDGQSLPSYNHQSGVDSKLGVTVALNTKDSLDCGGIY
jgi:hypothetical protein